MVTRQGLEQKGSKFLAGEKLGTRARSGKESSAMIAATRGTKRYSGVVSPSSSAHARTTRNRGMLKTTLPVPIPAFHFRYPMRPETTTTSKLSTFLSYAYAYADPDFCVSSRYRVACQKPSDSFPTAHLLHISSSTGKLVNLKT